MSHELTLRYLEFGAEQSFTIPSGHTIFPFINGPVCFNTNEIGISWICNGTSIVLKNGTEYAFEDAGNDKSYEGILYPLLTKKGGPLNPENITGFSFGDFHYSSKGEKVQLLFPSYIPQFKKLVLLDKDKANEFKLCVYEHHFTPLLNNMFDNTAAEHYTSIKM